MKLSIWRRSKLVRSAIGIIWAAVFGLGLAAAATPLRAQLLGMTGANHPELDWQEISTDHFTIIYHQGLDSVARLAAPMAEEVYHVVTSNLETPLPSRIRIYLSDNDEERNAFAFQDDYIFVWMRGILDDNLFSLRASGTSKWLRSVLTHEFTHIVIAHATHSWPEIFVPIGTVPSWFNEGMARYMEPDGWTSDLDIPLRVAAVSSRLDLGDDEFLSGHLRYEGGQSLVRYIAAAYGDSALVRILHAPKGGLGGYDFEEAVQYATKHSLHEIYSEWHKILNVYYNSEFGQKQEMETMGRKITSGVDIVLAARQAPGSQSIAILGKRLESESPKLYLLSNDTAGQLRLLTGEPGIAPSLAWSPDGKYILFSKIRFGRHASLVYDLYRCEAATGVLERLSTDDRLEYPDWSPDGATIVAAQFRHSGSDLVLLPANGPSASGNAPIRRLTHFDDDNVEVYSPRWSPDGKQVAFSIFRHNGMRDVATVDVASGAITSLTQDSLNDRYPIWAPAGDSVVFLSLRNGIPNLFTAPSGHPAVPRQLTDVASNVLAWDWPSGKDSMLVTSFASRNSVQLYWIPAHGGTASAPEPKLAPYYTAWRTVRWERVTRPQDSVPPVTIAGPYPYNSLAHVRPLLWLPLAGTDESHSGETGTQWGGFTFLMDEQQKHLLTAFALYGDVSHTFNYGIEYTNNQLLPSILVGVKDVVGFRNIIDDASYYEHAREAHLDLNFALHTPNSLTDLHELFAGAVYKSLTPWSTTWPSSAVAWHRPLAVDLLEFRAGYGFLTTLFQAGASVAYSNTSLASDLTRARLRAFLHKEIPLDEDARNQLALSVRGAADLGDELPQDFLGFYKYDVLEGGFDVTTLHAQDRVRGIREDLYGNRLIAGSVELREIDPLFSGLVPVLEAFAPQLVEFFDFGTTWYAVTPTNNPHATVVPVSGTQWLKSVGLELRSDLGFDVSLGGGVGWQLFNGPSITEPLRYGAPDWFFRIEGDF